jgi:hypothetical protein
MGGIEDTLMCPVIDEAVAGVIYYQHPLVDLCLDLIGEILGNLG